jgi:4-amino-4-deoxy-L-arabinose transferase-like glycosyltransferase
MIEKLKKNPHWIYIAGILLMIPALLINLGKVNIFMADDEGTRAIVALEMMIRENFITPTINGEFYYNKPPLFNWILVAFYSVFGINEFVLRLPTVISLIGFGFTVYLFVSRELGKKAGIITAFMFVTAGRLLFWESLLGYIDTTFSWVVYSGIMFIHLFLKQKKFLNLFIVSYFFMAIGFMLKGLPAVVFQGITLLVAFTAFSEFKRLFSWKHLVGGLFFLIPVGTYYLAYHQYNSLENVFNTLWHESAQRTVVEKGWVLTFRHLVDFPFEMLYHYLPWTLLLVFTFRKGFWSRVFGNTFIKFNLLVAFFNILPYWSSPDVYPKYIMMLVPMFYTVFIYFYLDGVKRESKLVRIIHIIFIVAALLLALGNLVIPFLDTFKDIPAKVFVGVLLFLATGFFAYLMIKLKEQRMVLFAVVLILGRLAFDWFVWPLRSEQYVVFEKDAKEVAAITEKEPVKFYKMPMLEHASSYYISLAKWQIVGKEHEKPEAGQFYITHEPGLDDIKKYYENITVYYSFGHFKDGRLMYLLKVEGL